MAEQTYDAIVVGAGPGGATAAALLARGGLRTVLLDKATFPRDKICGDAVSGKSMGVMRRLDLTPCIELLPHTPIRGVTFSGPGGDAVDIAFGGSAVRDEGGVGNGGSGVPDEGRAGRSEDGGAAPGDLPGFVCRRTVFDELLFKAAVSAGVEVREQTEVRHLRSSGGRVTGVGIQQGGRAAELRAPVVIGCDGAYSTVARELGMSQLAPNHYVAGLRSYYEGLNGAGRPGFIELHFVEEVLPGYFWIFDLPGGAANVGLGMLSATVKRRDVRLKPLLDRIIASDRFRERFDGARRKGPVVGWGLPLGSRPRKMAGDGWMLVGDAASLIDPFTGEGIGNAMLSGMYAADWSAGAHASGDFSFTFLKGYEDAVTRELRGELRLSHTLQRMLNWHGLVDLVIRKASRSDELASTISCMFDDLGARRKLLSPRFYWRVLRA